MAKPTTSLDLEAIDTVIQRKLLFDGTTNSDTKLLKVVSAFCNWCDSDETDKKTNLRHLTNLKKNVNRLEFDAKRTHHSIEAAEKIKEEYLALQAKIKEELVSTKQHVEKHYRLNEEMKIAKNERIQYEHLLSLVMSKPDRKAVEYKVRKLSQEVGTMQRQLEGLQKTIDIRKKQLTGLMRVAQELSRLINKNEVDEASPSDSNETGTSEAASTKTDASVPNSKNGKDSDLESVSGLTSVVSNCVEIQSDEEIEDAGAEYVLQIPATEEAKKSETLFVIQSEKTSFLDMILGDADAKIQDVQETETPGSSTFSFKAVIDNSKTGGGGHITHSSQKCNLSQYFW